MDVGNDLIYLEWDSSFFNKRIAKLAHCYGSVLSIDMSMLDLVQAKVDATDYNQLDFLANSGFVLAESEVDFGKTVTDVDVTVFNDINLATENDLLQIESISRCSFLYSRFREPWYSEDKKNELYEVWANKAVFGQFDDVCLVVRLDGQVAGFITVKLREKNARVGLLAVADKFQGMGVGKKLVALAEAFSSKRYAQKLFIATQMSNTSAMSLYALLGYRIESTSYWLYKGQ
jgi:dTDP-4-amino-4,6-dideoxy-D-galactose acyltransferase